MGQVRPPRCRMAGEGSMTLAEFLDPLWWLFLATLRTVIGIFVIGAAIALGFWLINVVLTAGRMIRDGEWGGWRR